MCINELSYNHLYKVKRLYHAYIELDFEIELFGSGEQLVSDYERHETPFHILILDIEMGGMNGIQTA
ncbi:hypothetical protein PAECIP111894_04336 [Paenibacillus pseudetheri]|uniref:Response regulatory domain-containing protein n=1 Tax=Paenibacillus pseudetheri TaxID=2897682 RepID=A0ABM9BI46_9BACL|nr:hypothetical protein PAECIP111894_04336 [Paenibacillus pseudetheri]